MLPEREGMLRGISRMSGLIRDLRKDRQLLLNELLEHEDRQAANEYRKQLI